MNILVIGANGGVGSLLVQQLAKENVPFTAGVRQSDRLNALKSQGMKAILVDVENDSIETLTETFKPFDKVIFSVGSGGNTGADKTIIVDLDGAVKSMIASKEANIKHYVMVSTYDSRRQAFDDSGDLKPYTIAKHYADDYLRRSGLNYTIYIQGTYKCSRMRKIEAAQYFDGKGEIPREDVATVLKEIVTSNHFNHQEFQIISGEQDIKDALTQFEIEKD